MHAWVLASADGDRALDYFRHVLRNDVADIQGGTTAEGIHLAAMAGSVDLLQRGFAGLETRGDTLWFNPRWPQGLGVLEFHLRYRECYLTVRIDPRYVRVSAEPGAGAPIRIVCCTQACELGPGDTVEFAV